MVATTPVINLPNVAMLWVSRITDRPRVISGKLEAGPNMACTLSFDHRFIDGAEGTAFINDLVDVFQQI
jgi:pyruvate/2-oxoglutarate dehydrogenase complex dihydrolipoamide acyltransferase (E2) component